MTRLMYDSITPGDLPADAPLVAGYIDGVNPWPASAWDRFTGVKVRIARNSLTNDGHVLDVEQGDAIPSWAPGWARLRRRSGMTPTIYVNRGNWQQVIDAFVAAAEPQPLYWVATLDGTQLPLVAGVIACQYAGSNRSGGHYDLSTVADYWPGVDTAPTGGKRMTEDQIIGWGHLAHLLAYGNPMDADTQTALVAAYRTGRLNAGDQFAAWYADGIKQGRAYPGRAGLPAEFTAKITPQ